MHIEDAGALPTVDPYSHRKTHTERLTYKDSHGKTHIERLTRNDSHRKTHMERLT